MLLLEGPTPDQLIAIREELGEDPIRMTHNIRLLKSWMSMQSHLPKGYDERMLPVFLRGCKHDLERTKQKIQTYFEVRASMPEIYTERDPTSEDIIAIRKIATVVPFPKLTPDGCRITLLRIESADASKFDLRLSTKNTFMIGDIRVVEECPLAGDVFIYDCQNLSAAYCAKFISPIFKQAMTLAHKAYPQRMKQIHIVNAPPFIDKLLVFIKSLLKEKLRNRFVLHRTPDTLLDYFPRDILPEEYNGTCGKLSVIMKNWDEYLLKQAKWFQHQEAIKATGPTRSLVHSNSTDDCMHGSFRQLTID